MFIQETSKFRSKHVSKILFLIPFKTETEQDVDELLLRHLISDQNLFLENEHDNLSCKRNLCLHFRQRTA